MNAPCLRLLGLSVLACVLDPVNGFAAQKIEDKANGFTLTVPDGFSPRLETIDDDPEILHMFVGPDPMGGREDIFLIVEKMSGTISPGPLQAKGLPTGLQVNLFTAKWQGFDVNGLELVEDFDVLRRRTLKVQVPLKPAAIQITLLGPMDRKADLERFVKEVLSGLKGESNWRPLPAQPKSHRSKSYWNLLRGAAIVYLLIGLLALWAISRNTPKGTLFIVATGLWIGTFTVDDAAIREVLLFKGITRMLGFLGVILGIVDLVRKRKSATESTPSSASIDQAGGLHGPAANNIDG